MHQQNVNQTNPFLLESQTKQTGPNFPHSSQNDSATRQLQTQRLAIQGTSSCGAILLNISTSDVEAGREPTGVLSAFVGSGFTCHTSLSTHLFDSISSSVTSADYVSSKQPATWRRRGAIILREWQRAAGDKYKKGWKQGLRDWKDGEMEETRQWWDVCVCIVNASMQVMQIKALWLSIVF